MALLIRIENKLLTLLDPLFGNILRRKFKNPGGVESVCFVCRGNICRSAYAEAQLKEKLKEIAPNIIVFSAGLDTTPGKPANPKAIEVSQTRGLNLSEHKTQELDEEALNERTLVFCMEAWQKRVVQNGNQAKNVFLLSNLSNEVPPFIKDPYGKSDAEFNACFDEIDICLEALSNSLNGK